MMAEVKEIYTERIDDVPLLMAQQEKMEIPQVLNKVINPHGHRQGLSVGWLVATWLSYMLSEADHRMSEVEPWAQGEIEMLTASLPEGVRVGDFTDDRLADILRLLSDDETWEEVERELGQRLIRVYELESGTVRLDSTSAAVYHDSEEGSLFQYGHSKDHRPDLAQFKVMLATIDPMGMPLATMVVAGNEADDGLYLPSMQRVEETIGQGAKLYIGDSKMGALHTRASIEASGNYYLAPLAQIGGVPQLLRELLEPIWLKKQPLERIYAPTNDEEDAKMIALGYDSSRSQEALVEKQKVAWDERVLVLYSLSLAKAARKGLAQRISKASQALVALTPPRARGHRQFDDLKALEAAATAIIKKHRVEGLLDLSYRKEIEKRSIRKYGERPARTEENVRYVIKVKPNQKAISDARRPLGWRLYVTNAPDTHLPLSKAILAYRDTAQMDRNFMRLKGRPLGIRPLYVEREDHAKGMVRLMSLALRVLTLPEHVVRDALDSAKEKLSGLYAGNPKRQTERPTTERLLKAFRGITLTVVKLSDQSFRHITPLSELQKRILGLLGLSPTIYENLASPLGPIPP